MSALSMPLRHTAPAEPKPLRGRLADTLCAVLRGEYQETPDGRSWHATDDPLGYQLVKRCGFLAARRLDRLYARGLVTRGDWATVVGRLDHRRWVITRDGEAAVELVLARHARPIREAP